jgi:hypothetical protein
MTGFPAASGVKCADFEIRQFLQMMRFIRRVHSEQSIFPHHPRIRKK